jgi:hypothetical protein
VRGATAPTHSRPWHWLGASGRRHDTAALNPRGKTPGTHCTGGWVPVWTQRIEVNSFAPAGDGTSIARSYSP